MTNEEEFQKHRDELSKNVKTPYIRDMRKHEDELHNEIRAHIWFLEKTGWTKEEIDYATLMRVNRETMLKFLQKTE